MKPGDKVLQPYVMVRWLMLKYLSRTPTINVVSGCVQTWAYI